MDAPSERCEFEPEGDPPDEDDDEEPPEFEFDLLLEPEPPEPEPPEDEPPELEVLTASAATTTPCWVAAAGPAGTCVAGPRRSSGSVTGVTPPAGARRTAGASSSSASRSGAGGATTTLTGCGSGLGWTTGCGSGCGWGCGSACGCGSGCGRGAVVVLLAGALVVLRVVGGTGSGAVGALVVVLGAVVLELAVEFDALLVVLGGFGAGALVAGCAGA